MIAESPWLRHIAALMAVVTSLTGVLATTSSAQALSNSAKAVHQPVQGQQESRVQPQGAKKITVKTMMSIIRSNKALINSTVKSVVLELPIPSSWKKKIIATFTAGTMLKYLGTITGVTDTVEGHMRRTLHRIAPAFVPDRIVNLIADSIAFVLL